MGISIIIPTLNRGSDLVETLNSITSQLGNDAEVIVVDQSESYDQQTSLSLNEILNKNKNSVSYLKIEKKSAGNARNFGVTKTKFDNLVFIDDDVILPNNFIKNYLFYLKANPGIDGIAGKVYSHENDSEKKLPKEFYDINVGFLFRPMNYHYELENADLGSCNMFIKKEVFLSLKGFDEKMLRLEDSDLSARFRQQQFKSKYIPEIKLFHKASQYGASRHVTMHAKSYASNLFWTEYFYFTIKNFGLIKGKTFLLFWLKEKFLNKHILLNPINFFPASVEIINGFIKAKKRLKRD